MIENKNSKDIFMRAALAGMLDFFNRNVKIAQVVNGNELQYDVKFYYNFGQDEQFMKDFFVELDHGCLLHEHAEGNFETRPVGVIRFSSFTIRPTDMTNRYVRGTFINEGYTQNMEKRLGAYSAYLMRLPMTLKVSIDVQADNLGQAMRVMEAILTTVYKSNVMYFQYKGLRVPAELLMSDGIDLDKKTEFTYDDSQVAHAKFDMDINTVFPVYDQYSVASKQQVLREFRTSLYDKTGETKIYDQTVNGNLYIEGLVRRYTNLYYDLTIPTGSAEG